MIRYLLIKLNLTNYYAYFGLRIINCLLLKTKNPLVVFTKGFLQFFSH